MSSVCLFLAHSSCGISSLGVLRVVGRVWASFARLGYLKGHVREQDCAVEISIYAGRGTNVVAVSVS